MAKFYCVLVITAIFHGVTVNCNCPHDISCTWGCCPLTSIGSEICCDPPFYTEAYFIAPVVVACLVLIAAVIGVIIYRRRRNQPAVTQLAQVAPAEPQQLISINTANNNSAQTYSQNGHNQLGYNQHGCNPPQYNQPGYYQPQCNQPGYNQPGHNQPSYIPAGHIQPGYIPDGYNQIGYNQTGYYQPSDDGSNIASAPPYTFEPPRY